MLRLGDTPSPHYPATPAGGIMELWVLMECVPSHLVPIDQQPQRGASSSSKPGARAPGPVPWQCDTGFSRALAWKGSSLGKDSKCPSAKKHFWAVKENAPNISKFSGFKVETSKTKGIFVYGQSYPKCIDVSSLYPLQRMPVSPKEKPARCSIYTTSCCTWTTEKCHF